MNTTSINQPRRQDRAKDDAWISAFLQKAPFGMSATEHKGQPYLKPTLFVYDPAARAIYFHGALEGHMRADLEANGRVCFSVAEMGRLLPADTAMEFGVEYASVVVFGRAKVIPDEAEARRALQLLLDKYFPHLRPERDYRPVIQEELNITAVYRLDIESWSGKEDQARPDFSGAFRYGEFPPRPG